MVNFLEYIKNPVTGKEILQTANDSIIANSQKIVDLQIEQWSDGEDKSGKIIGTYSQTTENIALEESLLGRAPRKAKVFGKPYNLDWSGGLVEKTFIKTKKTSKNVLITIDSKGKSLTELFQTIKAHGFLSNPNTIFGYQEKNLDEVTKIVKKDTLTKLKNRIK